ncbi:uncharacterized protein LOC131675793 [Phymastichus coffea]|uniref:uncharacterized protein LOC131675793 n=1 Tax=Phymastichus coffea TaxID=108790 RepID=UPI00273B308C|nr:uncharacterized protein LOC131675793 [Phymastichus coffea]XP_058788548.1 uncharacterized protein LOC131675793 [Phymastichus coffea]
MAEGFLHLLPNKDETVESIRDEIRREKLTKRKFQRDFNLSRTRSILGNLNDNDRVYDEQYVIETTKTLKKKTLPITEYRKLQNALIQNKSHINAFFTVEHAIKGLCRDLSGTPAQSKLAAANCSCNISLGDSKACFLLCKFIAPYLISELESTNQPLVEVCAWTIGNLCIGSIKAFSILHAQNCFQSLINLAKECPVNLLPAVSYACLRYIHVGITSIDSIDIQQLTQTIVEHIVQISDLDSETLWLLALLSANSENITHIVKLVPVIYEYLFQAVFMPDENIQKISAALRIICNTTFESSGYVAHILLKENSENICQTLDKLLCHQYIHLRNETLWLLGNLLNHNLETVQRLIKSIVPLLPSIKLALNSFNKTT